MKSKISVILFLLLVLFGESALGAENQDLRRSFRGVVNRFTFDLGKRTITIRLNILINGWTVNCARTRAVVWGIDRGKEQPGAPPFSRVYIINLEKGKIINQYTVTRGPFGATFSADRRMAMVDDYVVDQDSGEVVSMTYYTKLDEESCPSFPGKTAN